MPRKRLPAGAALAVGAAALAGVCCGPTGAAHAAGTAPAPSGAPTALRLEPASVAPGTTVTVRAAGCVSGVATGAVPEVRSGSFPLARGEGDREAVGRFQVPSTAEPGTYEVMARCAAGGEWVRGDLAVGLRGAYGGAGQAAEPRDAALARATGPGPLGRDPVRIACGVAVLAFAAVCGTWLLHRRARGEGL